MIETTFTDFELFIFLITPPASLIIGGIWGYFIGFSRGQKKVINLVEEKLKKLGIKLD